MELMRGSNEWANRKTDEGFDNFPDAIAKLKDRHTLSFETDLNLLDVARAGDIVAEDGEVVLYQPDGTRFGFDSWGFRALARKVGAHPNFLRKLPAENVASDLKVLLQDEDGLLAAQAKVPADEPDPEFSDGTDAVYVKDMKVLAQRPGAGNIGGLNRIRHLGSQRYGRIWDLHVMQWAWDMAKKYGLEVPPTFDARPRGLYVGPEDCFIFLGSGERTIEITRPDGQREEIKRGLMMWNSEVGRRTFGLCTFLYQMICGNHIVWGAEGVHTLETRHIGDAFGRAADELLPAVKGHLDASTDEQTTALARAMRIMVADKPDEAVRVLRAEKFTKGIAMEAVFRAKGDPNNEGLEPLSVMAIVNGITSQARDLENASARNVLEARASAFLRKATA